MANRTVGIDFGHGVVRGAEVEDPGTRRQRVVKRESVPLVGDVVQSGEVRDVAAVAGALRQLWSKAGFKTKRVALGLGNARVLARDLEVPVRPLAQIRESLPFLVADLLPMPLENAVLDYYPVSVFKDENGADTYNGMLIAALKDVALTNAKAASLAGLDVVGIDMIPFAIIRALGDRSQDCTAFVDVGATTTIIAVATGGTPEFVRTVPVGSEDVSRALMDLGGLGREQAEQVKRSVGLSAEGVESRYRPVVELMVTRTGDLMTSIRDTISYYADTRHKRISKIVLTGGGARLGGFAQMVAAWTRIPAELSAALPDMDFLVATAVASAVATPGKQAVGLVGARGSNPAPASAPGAPVEAQAAAPQPVAAPADQLPSAGQVPPQYQAVGGSPQAPYGGAR